MARSIPFRFAPIPEQLLYDPDVDAAAVRLWATIYRLADRVADPGAGLAVDRETIAGRLGWSEKTLTKWAKVLVERGYLDVRRPGQGKPNVYLPLVPDLESTDPSQLDGLGGSGPSSLIEISNTEKRPAAEAADALVKDWWNRQDPKPTQSFVAVRAVARAALRSGWDPTTLAKAMTEVPVISAGALDMWRSRQNGKGQRQVRTAVDLDRDAPEGVEIG